MKSLAKVFVVSLMGCASLIASTADAAGTNMILNGSFEDPPVPEGEAHRPGGESHEITNWMTTANGVDRFDPRIFGLSGSASDGTLAVDVNKYYGSGGGILQAVDTEIGKEYSLSFDVGTSGAIDGVGRVTVIAGDATQQCTVTGSGIDVVWQRCNLTFHAVHERTRVTFLNFSGGDEQLSLIDNVEMTEVP